MIRNGEKVWWSGFKALLHDLTARQYTHWTACFARNLPPRSHNSVSFSQLQMQGSAFSLLHTAPTLSKIWSSSPGCLRWGLGHTTVWRVQKNNCTNVLYRRRRNGVNVMLNNICGPYKRNKKPLPCKEHNQTSSIFFHVWKQGNEIRSWTQK